MKKIFRNQYVFSLLISVALSIFCILGIILVIPTSVGEDPHMSSLPSGSMVLHVGGTGDLNYTSIQEALDEADMYAQIFIHPGEYHENLVIEKPVVILGENTENTVVDGGDRGHVIMVMGGNVTIQGLTIQNSGTHTVGIFLNSSGNMIKDCCIIHHFHGAHAAYWDNNSFMGCTFTDNSIGVFLDHTDHTTISQCTITHNSEGLYLYENCNHNQITQCTLSHNTEGLFMRDLSNFNVISECLFSHNTIGVRLWDAKTNTFFLNTFRDNGNHVESIISDNLWNTQEKINYSFAGASRFGSVGNFWDDYAGNDTNGDGIGDHYYMIDADDDDRFPILPTKTDDNVPGFEFVWALGGLGGMLGFLWKKKTGNRPR